MKIRKSIWMGAVCTAVFGLSASADIIVSAWEFGTGGAATTNATLNIAGIDATMAYAANVEAVTNIVAVAIGSSDGTFGTGAGLTDSASVALGGLNVKGGTAGIVRWASFTITNNTAQALELSSFNFDFLRKDDASVSNVIVTVATGSAITSGDILNTGNMVGSPTGTGNSDYADYDVSLLGLADHTLAVGESATFKLSFTLGGGSYSILDNVAVTSIPEPATIGLFAISAASILFLRRLTTIR